MLFNKIETNIFYQLSNIKILDLYLGKNQLISQTWFRRLGNHLQSNSLLTHEGLLRITASISAKSSVEIFSHIKRIWGCRVFVRFPRTSIILFLKNWSAM